MNEANSEALAKQLAIQGDITSIKDGIAGVDTKLDGVKEDIGIIDGKVETVIEMLKERQIDENDSCAGNVGNDQNAMIQFHESAKHWIPVLRECCKKSGGFAVKHYSNTDGAHRMNQLLREDYATVMDVCLNFHCGFKGRQQLLQDGIARNNIQCINELLYEMKGKGGKLRKYRKRDKDPKLLYRVTGALPGGIVASLQVGNLFIDKAFLSTSKKSDIWSKKKDELQYLFEIECRVEGNGYVMGSDSSYIDEDEVLFYPGTRFEIFRVEAFDCHPVYGKITKISMREL